MSFREVQTAEFRAYSLGIIGSAMFVMPHMSLLLIVSRSPNLRQVSAVADSLWLADRHGGRLSHYSAATAVKLKRIGRRGGHLCNSVAAMAVTK